MPHEPGGVSDLDVVAQLEGTVPEDDQPGDEVRHRLFGREADRETGDAEARQHRHHVEAELGRRHEESETENDVLDELEEDVGREEIRPRLQRPAQNPPGRAVKAPEDEEDQDGGDEPRQKVGKLDGERPDESVDLVVPLRDGRENSPVNLQGTRLYGSNIFHGWKEIN